MPKNSESKKPFDQMEYIKEWGKKNMVAISGKYKKEFVQSFRDACKFLGIKQSDVFRNAMQNVIDEAKKKGKI